MEELDIIIEPELEFSLKKCGDVVPYGITPEERAKLAEYPEFEDLEFSHTNLTDKNSEAAFQHIDTTTVKTTLDEADKVALWDSVTGKVVLSPILGDINTALETILAIEV